MNTTKIQSTKGATNVRAIYYGEILQKVPYKKYNFRHFLESDKQAMLYRYEHPEVFVSEMTQRYGYKIALEKNDDIIHSEEDKVCLNGQSGIIKKKEFDVESNIIHYYTDIPLELMDNDDRYNELFKIEVITIKRYAERMLDSTHPNWRKEIEDAVENRSKPKMSFLEYLEKQALPDKPYEEEDYKLEYFIFVGIMGFSILFAIIALSLINGGN
jgi:hypothetical protein